MAKTTAGVTVYLKTGDYEQTLVADNRGIVRFTLPHTYAQGTRFTLTVYYGAGNSMSFSVEVTVGGAPYYKLFKRGSRGDGVYALTSRLSEMGYPVSPTDYYSDSVAAAVRLFQSANGLSADGMAGKLTQEKLYSVSAIGYSESGQTYPTLVRGDRGMALLYTLQQRLKDLGYYTIRVDGIFGSGTQRAVRWFQSVNGLSVTGKADNATQQLLYSAQAKAASGYSPDSYDTLSRSNRYKAAVVPLQRRLKALGYLSGWLLRQQHLSRRAQFPEPQRPERDRRCRFGHAAASVFLLRASGLRLVLLRFGLKHGLSPAVLGLPGRRGEEIAAGADRRGLQELCPLCGRHLRPVDV